MHNETQGNPILVGEEGIALENANMDGASGQRAAPAFDAELALHNDAETILANTPFLLTRCSSDLRYVFVSEAYAKMLGHRPEELVGKEIVKIMGETGFQTILPHIRNRRAFQ